MYSILNLIAFFVLSILGFYYLLITRPYLMKSPLGKQKRFLLTNHQYLLLFILATAILACGAMMANRLMICILLCALSLFLVKEKINFSFVFFVYFIYLIYLVFSWINSPVPNYGFRQFLKYLYPFLLMIFASRVPTSGIFYLKALKIILLVALVGSLFLVLVRTPLGPIIDLVSFILFWGPGIVDFLPVGVVICLALYSHSKKKLYLIYTILFVLPSIMWAWRTGILASAIAVVVFSIVRYRLKSIPYVVVGVFILVGSVLFIPTVRDKMFKEQMSAEEVLERRDELSVEDINSSARFAMWEWSLERYYYGHEIFGSGLGILQYAFYEREDNPYSFNGRGSQHNDYVQMLCDTGLIGLGLYLAVLFSLIIHSFIVYFNPRNTSTVRFSALISGCAMAGMMSTLYTDNVVTYSLMTLSYPFALYGMMLGLKNRYSHAI